MKNCSQCHCLTCELIDTCNYHNLCSSGNGQTQDYVKDCKDYKYSKENDEYFNGIKTN